MLYLLVHDIKFVIYEQSFNSWPSGKAVTLRILKTWSSIVEIIWKYDLNIINTQSMKTKFHQSLIIISNTYRFNLEKHTSDILSNHWIFFWAKGVINLNEKRAKNHKCLQHVERIWFDAASYEYVCYFSVFKLHDLNGNKCVIYTNIEIIKTAIKVETPRSICLFV